MMATTAYKNVTNRFQYDRKQKSCMSFSFFLCGTKFLGDKKEIFYQFSIKSNH